jgi:hypothetical protein
VNRTRKRKRKGKWKRAPADVDYAAPMPASLPPSYLHPSVPPYNPSPSTAVTRNRTPTPERSRLPAKVQVYVGVHQDAEYLWMGGGEPSLLDRATLNVKCVVVFMLQGSANYTFFFPPARERTFHVPARTLLIFPQDLFHKVSVPNGYEGRRRISSTHRIWWCGPAGYHLMPTDYEPMGALPSQFPVRQAPKWFLDGNPNTTTAWCRLASPSERWAKDERALYDLALLHPLDRETQKPSPHVTRTKIQHGVVHHQAGVVRPTRDANRNEFVEESVKGQLQALQIGPTHYAQSIWNVYDLEAPPGLET